MAHLLNYCDYALAEFVCVGDLVGLREEDGDGIGGLTAVEAVKYTESDERGAAEL